MFGCFANGIRRSDQNRNNQLGARRLDGARQGEVISRIDHDEKTGAIALGLLPSLEIPTEGGEHVQGSMAVPFAIKLSEKAELELMTEYDFVHNEAGSGYHVEFLNSGSLSYDWTSAISTYFEVATLFGTQNSLGGP